MTDATAAGIAVVGIDLKLPGSPSFNDVVNTGLQGRSNTTMIALSRLVDSSTGTVPNEHHGGGYFDQIDHFDHRFFGLSAKVAESMDPYQRHALLSSARAIADAGLTDQVARLRTGVYGSCNASQQGEYARLQREHGLEPDLMANLAASIAARISNVFDLRGPAIMVDTACSSSLHALSLACADLRAGVIEVAIVTSSNLYVVPGKRDSVAIKVVSERSETRAFDLAADGASVGEGVVTLVLRRASDVQESHYGQVVGWSSNQDGKTATMSSPNPRAQFRVIQEAWTGLNADQLGLFVTHGTGTAVGDSIELEGLSEVNTFSDLARQSVPLVAPKSNFGHLDAASGLLSVCIALAASSTGRVPPHPSFVAPLLTDGLVESAFFIPCIEHTIDKASLAAVSAFGITGTNVHVVVRGGSRRPGVTQNDDNRFDLQRRWFSPVRNTFAKAGAPESTEAFGVISRSFEIETFRDWEIAEHRVQGSPLMVGTSLLEIISRLLEDTAWPLKEYDLVDLHLHRPVSAAAPRLQILASLDTGAMRGMVRSREADRGWNTWATFSLRERQAFNKTLPRVPIGDDFEHVDVETTVGDDDTVEISGRWSVVTSMQVAHDRSSGLLELEAPRGMKQEFSTYAFYPALLDAALNGMNRTILPNDVLLPWMCDQFTMHMPRLVGYRFTAHIVKRTVTVDDLGHVVLTVDADLWDVDGKCVLSARGYRVKNQMGVAAMAGAFNDLVYATHKPELLAGDDVFLLPSHMKGYTSVPASSRTVHFELEALDLREELFDSIRHAIIGFDPRYSDSSAEESIFSFGQLLLHVHLLSNVDHVTVICPGGLGESDRPFARAVVALAYSLRTELRFDVAVLDASLTSETFSTVRGLRLRGLNRLTSDGRIETGRFERIQLLSRPDWGDEAFTVLIIGASSGIGKAYAEYLVAKYPTISVIGVGRRPSVDFSSERFTYIAADITVASDVAELWLAASNARYVINLAGQPSEGLFLSKERIHFNSAMGSKMRGSMLLLSQFPSADEVILVSSVAGAVGAMGQADYAAANAFQTALVDSDTTSRREIRSLSLSGWKTIGMAAGVEDGIFEKVNPDEGLIQLHAFVTSTTRRAFVFRAKADAKGYSPLLSSPAEFGRTKLAEARVKLSREDGTDATRLVGEAWDLVLGQGRYDPDTSFFEYGGDSISIVQLCDALNQSCGDVFDVTTLFSSSTINKQAEFLRDSFVETSTQLPNLPDISDIIRMLNNTEEVH